MEGQQKTSSNQETVDAQMLRNVDDVADLATNSSAVDPMILQGTTVTQALQQ